MRYNSNIIMGLIFFVIVMQACTPGSNTITNSLYPSPPDTTNFYVLANYLGFEEVAYIISEETILRNGKIRSKGIVAVPLYGDDFRGHSFDNVYWQGANVPEGDFRGCFFHSSNCIEGDFSYSDFRVCDMKWALFDHSNLVGCNFNQAEMSYIHADEAVMDSSTFRGTNMFAMEACNASLRNCDFSYALMNELEFVESDFTGSTAIKVKLIRAVLLNAKIDSTDLCYSDFSGATLDDASFIRARLHGVNFQDSNLKGVDFTGADLKDCNFFGAEFENTVFKDAINIPEELKNLITDNQITGVCYFGRNKG